MSARTIVGAFLNFRDAWEAAAPAMARDPHNRPPVHPVLYLKPANTWAADGDVVALPEGVDEVEVGATLGVVFGRAASRVRARDALSFVAGYTVVNDVTVPHASMLRPPMRQKCRDGFCPVGTMVPCAGIDPDALTLRAYVDGQLRLEASTANLVRPVAQLIEEVSEFMTLSAGDILLVGLPAGLPRAGVGQSMRVEVDGVGRIDNVLQRERAPA
jgi:5-oxopent-3-ene-1,2,5-tricarboxylate decarboxylase / 2-hydroxyhepta-2,4-diene-1,7-dioate isomerase